MNIEHPPCSRTVAAGATSLFDVRCSMLDGQLLKTTPYGINATCERLHNNLALMGMSG